MKKLRWGVFKSSKCHILLPKKLLNPFYIIFHLHSKSLTAINSISEALTFKWIRIHIHKHPLSLLKSWFIQDFTADMLSRLWNFPTHNIQITADFYLEHSNLPCTYLRTRYRDTYKMHTITCAFHILLTHSPVERNGPCFFAGLIKEKKFYGLYIFMFLIQMDGATPRVLFHGFISVSCKWLRGVKYSIKGGVGFDEISHIYLLSNQALCYSSF